MSDVTRINRAVYDTLRQVEPDCRFIFLMWTADDPRVAISSNVPDRKFVSDVMRDAAGIVATAQEYDIALEDTVGNA